MKDEFAPSKKGKTDNLVLSCVEQEESNSKGKRRGLVLGQSCM